MKTTNSMLDAFQTAGTDATLPHGDTRSPGKPLIGPSEDTLVPEQPSEQPSGNHPKFWELRSSESVSYDDVRGELAVAAVKNEALRDIMNEVGYDLDMGDYKAYVFRRQMEDRTGNVAFGTSRTDALYAKVYDAYTERCGEIDKAIEGNDPDMAARIEEMGGKLDELAGCMNTMSGNGVLAAKGDGFSRAMGEYARWGDAYNAMREYSDKMNVNIDCTGHVMSEEGRQQLSEYLGVDESAFEPAGTDTQPGFPSTGSWFRNLFKQDKEPVEPDAGAEKKADGQFAQAMEAFGSLADGSTPSLEDEPGPGCTR